MDVRNVERLRDAAFRKSDKSGDLGCVEVAFVEDVAGVRDSHDRSGPILAFGEGEWATFLEAAKQGSFDRS